MVARLSGILQIIGRRGWLNSQVTKVDGRCSVRGGGLRLPSSGCLSFCVGGTCRVRESYVVPGEEGEERGGGVNWWEVI